MRAPPSDRWREQRAPRILAALATLAGLTSLASHVGVLSISGASARLLDGFAVGSAVALFISWLAGGPLPEQRVRRAPGGSSANASEPPAKHAPEARLLGEAAVSDLQTAGREPRRRVESHVDR